MARGPRPTKLTPQVGARICWAIETGAHYETAARWAQIDVRTFRRWMKQGVEDGSGVYHDFAESVREAEAQAEVRALEYWRSAMLTDWRAAAGFLSRRHPERWGDKATEAAGMLNRDNWTDPVYDPEAIELGVTYLAALEALKKRNPVVELDARIDGLLERRDRDREPD